MRVLNEMLKIILSLSVSGGLLAIVLLALKPLYKSRLRKSWQYYIWLVVLLRMLLPFAPEASLLGMLSAQTSGATDHTLRNIVTQNQNNAVSKTRMVISSSQSAADTAAPAAAEPSSASVALSDTLPYLWLAILIITVVLLAQKVVSYRRYIQLIKAGCQEVADESVISIYNEIRRDMGIGRPIPIYKNSSVSTPMLVGMVRSYIVLPEACFTDDNYRMIFRHELIHFKRHDIIYKWLVETIVCLHWFNPVVYFIRKEICEDCELSCDEAVVSSISAHQRRDYGDALMVLIQNGGKEQKHAFSMTMSEDGKNLVGANRRFVSKRRLLERRSAVKFIYLV